VTDIIYNEGRVVGFSAYETYIRQHLSELGSSIEPASEREWLASMLDGGSAVLLKIPAGISNAVAHNTGWFYLDMNLPNTNAYMTRLCAANTITAHLFAGHGNYTINSFPRIATSIASYGDLIPNTQSEHPTGAYSSINSVPITAQSTALDAMKHKAELYAKIIDGVVIQPGTWVENPNASGGSPSYFLQPDLKKSPGIRLKIAVDSKADFDEDVEILLIGWTNRSVVAGEVGTSLVDPSPTASGTPNPLDQDFLGPATFPWASKIVFVTPSYSMYWANQRLDEIEDKIEGMSVTTVSYEDVTVSGLHGSTETVEDAIIKVMPHVDGQPDDPVFGLSMKSRSNISKLDETYTVNANSLDGYIKWSDLIPALHNLYPAIVPGYTVHGRIDALTSFLRQLSNSLSDASSGQYVINVENNNITLGDYVFSDDEISKFQLNLIPSATALGSDNTFKGHCRLLNGSTVTGNKPMFKDMKLDLFGYMSTYNNGTDSESTYTHTLNMLATLTMIKNDGFQFGANCDQWYQVFVLDDRTNICTLLNVILSLRKGSANTGSNSIMIASGGRSMLRNADQGVWGASCWVHTDIMAYIRIKGIISAINSAGIADTIVKFNSIASSGSPKIYGVVYGRSDLIGGASAPYSASGSFSSCAVTGAVGITERLGGQDNWPNTGTITATAELVDGTTRQVTINLS
jgi:hypothetical protein